MALNYAEQWQPNLLEIIIGDSYASPFIRSNVKWLNAKTFHYTQMSTTGYQNHNRAGGWNQGQYNQTDVPFTVMHDRDIEFLVDKADVDETNATASIQNITETFLKTQAIPEMDAQFFSTVATKALATDGCHSTTKLSAITSTTVVRYLKNIFKHKGLKRYKARGALIAYVSTDVMTALELSEEFTRTISITSISGLGASINTRITSLDGVTLIEVIDDERFKTEFDYSNGFVPTSSAKDINVLVVTPMTTLLVPKIASVYGFAPGEHTKGDGWLYQNRSFWDTFVMPNGLDGKIDSIYVDTLDTTAARSAAKASE